MRIIGLEIPEGNSALYEIPGCFDGYKRPRIAADEVNCSVLGMCVFDWRGGGGSMWIRPRLIIHVLLEVTRVGR